MPKATTDLTDLAAPFSRAKEDSIRGLIKNAPAMNVTSLDEGSNKKYVFESGSKKDKRLRSLDSERDSAKELNVPFDPKKEKEYQKLLKEDKEQTDYPKSALVAQGGYMRSRYSNGGRVGILSVF